MTVRIVHKNSTAEDKRPTAGQLANGEIAVNLNEEGAFLSVKDTAGNIQQVGGVKVSSTSPSNPVYGTLWVDEDDNTLYVYDGSAWRKVAGGSGGGGQNVIAGDGLTSTQSGSTVTLDVVGGPGIVVSSADDWVAVDLQADGDRTGGNGLELTATDETGELRGKIATPSDLGVVRVDNSTITINNEGVLEAQIPQALNFKGNLNITDSGTDPEPASPEAGDTYTSVPGGTIGSPWTGLIDGWSSGDTTSAGDLIICNADGGGTGNWVRVPTGGNEVWVEDSGGYVYPSNTGNEVRIPAIASTESGDGTAVAMLDDDGQLHRDTPTGSGIEVNSGSLVLDNTFTPGTGDGDGQLGYWTRTDADDMLRPATLGDNVELRSAADAVTISFNSDGTAEFTGDVTISSDGFLRLPVGTDLERPATPAAGMVRFTNQNTTPPVAGTQRGYLDITTSTTEPTTAVGDTYTVQAAGSITSQWQGFLSNEPSAAVVGDYVVCQVNGGGTGNWTYVSASDPANFVEMYNGTNWVQMLDETTVGTSPDQVPANQMLGQMAFIDNVATLRPYTPADAAALAAVIPVFVGECIVIWDAVNHDLVYRYRDTATTYRQATVSFGAQVTG